MGVYQYDSINDELVPIAGQGKAEYGASTERKGDIIIPATAAGFFQSVSVVFAQAMPDNDYAVVIDEGGNTWAHCSVNVTSKTATGFTLFFYNAAGTDAPQMTFKYRAFKLYTDTEYNNLLNNAVLTSDVTNVIENGNMNPVTSNAVRALFSAYEGYTDITPMESGGSLTVPANSFGTWIKTNIDFTNPHDIFIPRFFGNGIIIMNWSVQDGKLIFLPYNIASFPVTLDRVWFNTIKVVAE